MTPPDSEDTVFGPSESDIERAERKAFEPDRGSSSSGLWKILALLFALIAIAALVLNILLPLFPTRSSDAQPSRQPVRVVDVVDGRTLLVETDSGRRTVRYIGVAPHSPGSRFADYAAEVSRHLVVGKDVLLESDKAEQDGEVLLRYVIVDDTLVNLVLIAAGVTSADLDGPNDRYRELFRQYEQTAKSQRNGIWSAEETGHSY